MRRRIRVIWIRWQLKLWITFKLRLRTSIFVMRDPIVLDLLWNVWKSQPQMKIGRNPLWIELNRRIRCCQ